MTETARESATRTWIVGVDCGRGAAPLCRFLRERLARESDVVRLVHVIPGVSAVAAMVDVLTSRAALVVSFRRTFPATDSVSSLMGDFYPVSVPDEEQYMYQSTPMLRREIVHEETAQRLAAIQWIQDHLAPILEEARLPYVIDIVPYETQSSSIGEILVEKASLIEDVVAVVLASSSKGRIREFFVGSVCNYVLHHSRCPVFVFKPTDEDEKREEERVAKLAASKNQDKQQKAE